MRLTNPLKLRDTLAEVRKLTSGRGPQLLRVTGVGQPEGLLVPAVPVSLEIKARNGRVARFSPSIPIPFPFAWSYRLARRLGVPVISDIDPKKLRFEVPVPGASSG